MKQKLQALLYYSLIILAVHITGCRNAADTTDTGGTDELTAPTGVTATATSTTEVGVTWSNPDYSKGFKVLLQYKKSADTSYTEADVAQATSHALTALEINTAYDIRLKAVGDDGTETAFTSVVNVTTMSAVVTDTSHPVATITAATVYDGQVRITHAWSSMDYSKISFIYCESKLVSGSAWVAYKTSTSTNFSNYSYCYTNINGTENIGKRTYRIRVTFSDLAPETISSVSAGLVAKLPAPTNLSFVGNLGSITTTEWDWFDTFDPAYHTGFVLSFLISGATSYSPNNGTVSVAMNDFDAQTNVCTWVPTFIATQLSMHGRAVTFKVTAIGGYSGTHHDYPMSSDYSAIVTGTCP